MKNIKSWSDIPKFTEEKGSVSEFELFKYFVGHIEDEIKEGLKLEPDFQRTHVWTKEQQVAYIEYILMGGLSGRDIYVNAPNWPSVDDDGSYVLVDGLQRITAILEFYHGNIQAFGKYFNEFEGSSNIGSYMRIHVNTLATREQVLQWYIELNTTGVPHSKEEIDRVKELLNKERKHNS